LIATTQAQNYPPPFPRDGVRKLFENERVVVWDALWQKDRPTPLHEHRFDQISVTLVGGKVRVTKLDGTSTTNQSEIGSITLTTKGTVHREEGLNEVPQHKIMVELKTAPGPEVTPGGSPIEGAVKVTENERVVAWDFTWKPGQRVPWHGNARASLWVFLTDGKFRSSAAGGALAAAQTAGQASYVPPTQKSFTEEAVQGMPRAIILEIK